MPAIWKISKRARRTRARMVAVAEELVKLAPGIHYSQDRPYYEGPLSRTPYVLDCSGSVIRICESAGAPDPAGLGFNGYGNTDTILAHLRAISPRQARRGDLVLWHLGADGRHVAMLLESPRWHRDPELYSHGGEYGPLRLPLSSEERYHADETRTFLRAVPVDY